MQERNVIINPTTYYINNNCIYLSTLLCTCLCMCVRQKRTNLSHYLPSIEEHFISFSESILRYTRLLLTLTKKKMKTNH